MPSPWTTDEQRAFLEEELVTFKRIGGRRYTKQWPALFQRWAQKWPERCVVFPDLADDAQLTEEQGKIHTQAVLCRQQQIRRWMHWHNGAGLSRSANNKTCKIVDGLLENKTRAKKPCELYSNVNYKTHILPHIEPGMSIAEVNKKIREIFDNESPEVKEKFIRLSEEQKWAAKTKYRTGSTANMDSDDELDLSTLCR